MRIRTTALSVMMMMLTGCGQVTQLTRPNASVSRFAYAQSQGHATLSWNARCIDSQLALSAENDSDIPIDLIVDSQPLSGDIDYYDRHNNLLATEAIGILQSLATISVSRAAPYSTTIAMLSRPNVAVTATITIRYAVDGITESIHLAVPL